MDEHRYENCVIGISLEGNAYALDSGPNPQADLFNKLPGGDYLDEYFEDSLAAMYGLRSGVYFCAIVVKTDIQRLRGEWKVFVEDIVPAILTRGGE